MYVCVCVYIHIYIYRRPHGVTHNKTVTFITAYFGTSNLAHELDQSVSIMMTTVDREIVPG
jgi:hypothetical protein